jgi:hypothetical protein
VLAAPGSAPREEIYSEEWDRIDRRALKLHEAVASARGPGRATTLRDTRGLRPIAKVPESGDASAGG